MAQIFHRSTNTLSRISIYGFVFFWAAVGGLSYKVNQSAYFTEINVARDQPVPFSHKHHAGELGIDCRYCHTSVEQSSFAGIPATHVCMSCHSQIWVRSPMLEPVRASYAADRSIEWTRVNAVPDFVYFSHRMHIARGVSCEQCHGDLTQQQRTFQANTLNMGFCLSCHRQMQAPTECWTCHK